MSGHPLTRRVVKLGGSLLSWQAWPAALRLWLQNEPPATTLIVVGGGVDVDAIRRRQPLERLTDEQAHWQAVEAMTANARRVADVLGEAALVSDWQACTDRASCFVFDPQHMLRHAEGLPTHWGFTSDSIAAWVARQWALSGACELVLLKSRHVGTANWDQWVAERFVDECFPHFARGCSVRCQNLRTLSSARQRGDLIDT